MVILLKVPCLYDFWPLLLLFFINIRRKEKKKKILHWLSLKLDINFSPTLKISSKTLFSSSYVPPTSLYFYSDIKGDPLCGKIFTFVLFLFSSFFFAPFFNNPICVKVYITIYFRSNTIFLSDSTFI